MCSLCPDSLYPREIMREKMNGKWKILSINNAFQATKHFMSITCLLLKGQHNILKFPYITGHLCLMGFSAQILHSP